MGLPVRPSAPRVRHAGSDPYAHPGAWRHYRSATAAILPPHFKGSLGHLGTCKPSFLAPAQAASRRRHPGALPATLLSVDDGIDDPCADLHHDDGNIH